MSAAERILYYTEGKADISNANFENFPDIVSKLIEANLVTILIVDDSLIVSNRIPKNARKLIKGYKKRKKVKQVQAISSSIQSKKKNVLSNADVNYQQLYIIGNEQSGKTSLAEVCQIFFPLNFLRNLPRLWTFLTEFYYTIIMINY